MSGHTDVLHCARQLRQQPSKAWAGLWAPLVEVCPCNTLFLVHSGQTGQGWLSCCWYGTTSSLNLGSSALFIEPDPGMSWTTENIVTIAGELSWGPSSSQEGQRKRSGKSPPEDRAMGSWAWPGLSLSQRSF